MGSGVRHEFFEVCGVQRGFFLNFSSLASTILYKTLSFSSLRRFLNLSWMVLLIRRIAFRIFAKKWFFTPLSVLCRDESTGLRAWLR